MGMDWGKKWVLIAQTSLSKICENALGNRVK